MNIYTSLMNQEEMQSSLGRDIEKANADLDRWSKYRWSKYNKKGEERQEYVHNGCEETETAVSERTESLGVENSSNDADAEDSSQTKLKSIGIQTDLTLLSHHNIYTNDDFGWSPLLEEKEYFFEAYNKDGQELVTSYLEIVRTPSAETRNISNAAFESEEGTPESSKTNTRYSTASEDSCCSERVDDEGIVVERRTKGDEPIVSGRRETITDDQGNIRIERFNNHLQTPAWSKSVKDQNAMPYLEIAIKTNTSTETENISNVQTAAAVFESEEGTPGSYKSNTRYSTASVDGCYNDRVVDERIVVERRTKSYEDIVSGRMETITDDRGFARIYRSSNSHLQRSESSKSVNDQNENIAQFAEEVFELEESSRGSYKGNTRCSTASVDSIYSGRVCDEGIVMERRTKSDEDIVNGRKKTITDGQSINDGEAGSNTDRDQGRLKYIFQEIIETERKYVSNLGNVVDNYKPYIERNIPVADAGRACYIFGNIGTIYNRQRHFLQELEECFNLKCIVQKFIDHHNLFKLYPQYFKNKPRADTILKEYDKVFTKCQHGLEDRLGISAYLLTPLQRLGKYKLFLENILKYFAKNQENTDRVQEALEMIKNELQTGNDLLVIESIVEKPLKMFVYGSLIKREKFICVKPKKMEVVVFLFQEIVVLTTENQNQKNIEEFQYWTSINMRDLGIATYENDLSIHLTDFTKSKRKFTLSTKYTIILESKDEKCKEMWRKDIENILWKQLEQAKELQKNPKIAQETENKTKLTGDKEY